MKKRVPMLILMSVSAVVAAFLLIQDLRAEEGEKFAEKDRRGGRGKLREEMLKKHPHLRNFAEGKKWLKDAREFKNEIDMLAQELEPVRKKVRSLCLKTEKAASDEEKEQIRAELKIALKKQDDLELEMAEKRREFSEKNFKIALERMIQAEVEYRETIRKIEWRNRVIEKQYSGPGHRGRYKRLHKNTDTPEEGR